MLFDSFYNYEVQGMSDRPHHDIGNSVGVYIRLTLGGGGGVHENSLKVSKLCSLEASH